MSSHFSLSIFHFLDQTSWGIIDLINSLLNEFIAVGSVRALYDLWVSGLEVSVKDILLDRVVEDTWLLHNKGQSFSKSVQVVGLDVDSVQVDCSELWVIETHHQVHEGTLTATGLTDEGDGFIWINGHCQPFQDEVIFSCWVSEPHIEELNLSFDFGWVKFHFWGVLVHLDSIDFRWLLDDLEDSGGRDLSFTHIRAHGGGSTGLIGSEEDGEQSNEDILRINWALWNNNSSVARYVFNLILTAIINDQTTEVEEGSEDAINDELGESKGDSSLAMLGLAHAEDGVKDIFVLLQDQVFVSEWLHSFEIVNGVTDQKISGFFHISRGTRQTFLELHTNEVTNNDKWNASKSNQRLLPAENESDNKTTDKGKEGLNIWCQAFTGNSVDQGTFRGHSTGKDTRLVILMIEPADVFLQDGHVKNLSNSEGHILSKITEDEALSEVANKHHSSHDQGVSDLLNNIFLEAGSPLSFPVVGGETFTHKLLLLIFLRVGKNGLEVREDPSEQWLTETGGTD